MRRLSVLMAVCFVDMIGLMIVAPLLPYYALRLGAAEWMVGPLIASFAVAQLASSPLWGRVSDRYGRRPALLIGLSASAVAYVIFGVATSLWVLFASRLAQGLGGGTVGVAQAYVADTMAPSERAKALGWLSAATSAGVIIGPALGSLASHWGPEAPGLFAAALVLLNVLFAWRWLPESRVPHHAAATAAAPDGAARPSAASQPRPIAHALWEVVRHPMRAVPLLIWIYAVGMLALNVLIGVLALYLKFRFGITEHTIGYVFMVFGIVGVVMRTAPVGWVNAWIGEVRTMRLGAALLALGLALMPQPTAIAPFVLCLMLVPLGTALLFPATSSLVSQHSVKSELGQTMGVQQTFRGIMSILGPIGGSLAYQDLGPSVPFFLAAGIVALVVPLAWWVPAAQPAAAAT